MAVRTARFRFYGCLTDLLRPPDAGGDHASIPGRRYAFRGTPSVKNAIEAQGVPHPEVDLILVDGSPVGLDAPIDGGERVGVYPFARSLGRPDGALRPSPPDPPRFVCDVHLGRLARFLRMIGRDVRYATGAGDAALARVSDAENRILLTRDRELLNRSRVTHGAFVRAQDPDRRRVETVARFNLDAYVDPFTRCLNCNTLLEPVRPERVADDLPDRVRRAHDSFYRCRSCDRTFWEGSHVDRMRDEIRSVLCRASNG